MQEDKDPLGDRDTMCRTETHVKHTAFDINRNEPFYDSYSILSRQ